MSEQDPEATRALIACLEAQYPNPYDSGRWYPAALPNGRTGEMRRTQGKGKNAGAFLHFRYRVRLVMRDQGSSEKHDAGTAWSWWRINVRTGEITNVS